MNADSDNFILEEDISEIQLPSNDSVYTEPTSLTQADSNIFLHSSSSSSNFVSEETYSKQLANHVQELKAELQTRCHLDWLNKFEPSEDNPKIELNLLLHDAIRERTLKQLAVSKGISFNNDERLIAAIFQNDHCLLQRIFQEIINDQRQQRTIYTEIIFRPDVFNFENETSRVKLKDVMSVIIDCIRFFTSTAVVNNGINTSVELNTIQDKINKKSFISDSIFSLPIHTKIILSCNWNNTKNIPQFIRLAHDYPDEIVGIDLYGSEDDCRKYWHDFRKYTKILRRYQIRYQASMNNYKDLQLMIDVITGLNIERLCEAYEIVLSSKYMENILIKHGVYLVVCPISHAYIIVNQQVKDNTSDDGEKREYQSISLLNNSSGPSVYNLMNHLQKELINYSITSLSPRQFKQNLPGIYKNLFENNKKFFTCEYMQELNENAIKSSFASQKLKSKLINYIRENYTNCYQQAIFLKQFQETTYKWQQEMSEIIDKNAEIAIEFSIKMRKEKILKRLNRQHEIQTTVFEEDEGEEENEENQPD